MAKILCVPLDPVHDVGIKIINGELVKHGHQTLLLQPDLPMETIVKKASEGEYDFIMVSRTLGYGVAELLARFTDLLDAAGIRERSKVVIGGKPVTPELAAELGYDKGFGAQSSIDEIIAYVEGRELPKEAAGLTRTKKDITGGYSYRFFDAEVESLLNSICDKLLAWAESPAHYLAVFRADPRGLLGGKTIVGGLLGGWAGVALAKRACRVVRSTGDLVVYPLALGTAVGRVGCFLTGLADRTYGVATTLPWGVDFGDHVARHPTQLYESLFVLAWALVLRLAAHRGRGFPPGALFRLYLAGYLAFRFLVEFIKPRELLLGPFSAIQLASLAGATLSLVTLRRPAPSIQNPQSKFKI